MKAWRVLDKAVAPGGGELVLSERDGTFVIRVDGQELMSSRQHGSEDAMATAAIGKPGPKSVLIGGLGLGYTLRAVLDRLGTGQGRVTVVELSEAVVRWNHGALAPLAAHPLADPRVTVRVEHVLATLDEQPAAFDAVLLDVDNGPSALSAPGNARIYQTAGLTSVRKALRPGGRVVVWSAGPDAAFLTRLHAAGFEATSRVVPSGPGAPRRHVLFVGEMR
jgi:spermidine synthase